MKEASAPAHAPYLPKMPEEFAHEGKRVVTAQRALQASPDLLLGWTSIDGRPLLRAPDEEHEGRHAGGISVRRAAQLLRLCCGGVLARAHARNGEPALIDGYCGSSTVLDEALADWAEAYGDQNASDHAAFVEAIQTGRIKAVKG